MQVLCLGALAKNKAPYLDMCNAAALQLLSSANRMRLAASLAASLQQLRYTVEVLAFVVFLMCTSQCDCVLQGVLMMYQLSPKT